MTGLLAGKERATATANAGILRCAQNDKAKAKAEAQAQAQA
jgi:hypothetical protein